MHGRNCWDSRWNRVASSLQSIAISTSGFRGRHFEIGRRPTSGNDVQCRRCHMQVGPVESVGVDVEIAAPSLIVQKLFSLPL